AMQRETRAFNFEGSWCRTPSIARSACPGAYLSAFRRMLLIDPLPHGVHGVLDVLVGIQCRVGVEDLAVRRDPLHLHGIESRQARREHHGRREEVGRSTAFAERLRDKRPGRPTARYSASCTTIPRS